MRAPVLALSCFLASTEGNLQCLDPSLNGSLDTPLNDTLDPPLNDILDPPLNGSCSAAVDAMAFHRQKMTEYQCRRFLAGGPHDVEGRSLLEDAGSKKYQDWLARSSTLEDIYRQYEHHAAEDAPLPAAVPNGYDGDVTGYAMVGNQGAPQMGGGYPSGYSSGSSYGGGTYHVSSGGGGSDKGMKLNDLFHLALTAIAFLAFGTFICEVIMCVVGMDMTNRQSPTTVMLVQQDPFEASLIRSTRATTVFLDEIVRGAVSTLDAVDVARQDGGRRLQRALCAAGHTTRGLSGVARLWLPLWSLGMSWIGGRLSGRSPLALLTETIRGIAGAPCHLAS